MLEVNPYEPGQRDKLVKVLEDWFSKMGIKKFLVAETTVPRDTKTIINLKSATPFTKCYIHEEKWGFG